MLVLPAIDLRGGQCVRLRQGDYTQETVFGDDPSEMARRWADQGASYLHLVDLDGARDGRPVNGESVRAIVRALGAVPCQLGGGLRTEADIEEVLGWGVARAIVGTRALRDPAWLEALARRFPDQIVLGLDARDGLVATDGWLAVSRIKAIDLARQCADWPLAALVFTDIHKDGMLAGPNVEALAEMARAVPLPVIASGGVTTVDDVRRLARLGLAGCIIGRALYEGRLDLPEVLRAAAEPAPRPLTLPRNPMAKYKVEDIRNIALVGHGAAGKTSLADALLFAAKASPRRGCVDEGTSYSDYDEEEHKRRFSIDTTSLHLEHKGKQIHLLDTPGYPDFAGAALAVLDAVETAVVVISAPNGIEVNARRMFHEAGRRGLARMIVLNKCDGENIHFDALLKAINDTFGKSCVLFNAPNGLGTKFTGVVSVLTPPDSPPADCPVDLAAVRGKLVDAVVEADEALMEKYLLEGSVTTEELVAAIPTALAAGTVVPIFCTAAKKDKDIGVPELLDALADDALSPVAGKKRTAVKGTGDKAQEVTLEPSESGEFVAQVFKTLSDKFVGNLSFFRIYSGKLTAEQPLYNVRNHKSSRTGGLLLMQGKEQKPVTEAIAGDIIAVAKVEDLNIGDTIGTGASAPKMPPLVFPMPMFGLAVEPKARGDEQKISTSLSKIAHEDATFHVTRDAQTHEMVITGMSQLHLDVLQHRLKRRFELEVVTKEPKIPYRETITTDAAADYRHKKQSGGRGQFGEVHLRVYPLKDLDISTAEELTEKFANKSKFEKLAPPHYDGHFNFAFLDHIVGGTIPVQFIPAVEKGCKELLERGVLAGYRMQDVAVEVHFGKDHPVDSSEAAFKTAGRMAFKKAFLAARPVLLEPIVNLEVTLPSKYTGAILSDLNTKRVRIENQDSLPGDLAVISAKAPLAEVMRYAAVLGSITQGQGSYTMEFSHYDQVPGNVQQQIVSKAKVADDEED